MNLEIGNTFTLEKANKQTRFAISKNSDMVLITILDNGNVVESYFLPGLATSRKLYKRLLGLGYKLIPYSEIDIRDITELVFGKDGFYSVEASMLGKVENKFRVNGIVFTVSGNYRDDDGDITHWTYTVGDGSDFTLTVFND